MEEHTTGKDVHVHILLLGWTRSVRVVTSPRTHLHDLTGEPVDQLGAISGRAQGAQRDRATVERLGLRHPAVGLGEDPAPRRSPGQTVP